MALQANLWRKILVWPHYRASSLSRTSYEALRYISGCSVMKRRFKNSNAVLMNERKLLHNVKPNLILNHVLMTMCSTLSSSEEDEDILESDSHISEEIDWSVFFETESSKTDEEWHNAQNLMAKTQQLKNVTDVNGLIMRKCLVFKNLPVADSYLQFLKREKIEPNLLAMACYLELCGLSVEQCGENKVLEVYKDLSSRVKMFDGVLGHYAVMALTKTSEWKQAFKHLPIIRHMNGISSKVYGALICALFRNGEYANGWKLYETMHKENRGPHPDIFIEWFKQTESSTQKEDMLTALLEKLRLFEYYPKVPVAENITRLFKDELNWSGKYVKISKNGVCPACQQILEPPNVDKASFLRLKEEFLSRVLHGSDIFQTTSLEEWNRFASFVKNEGPFNTVVDGLNISYVFNTDKRQRLKLLSEVITKIKQNNKDEKILVLGRKHMEQWSYPDWKDIKRKAKVFTLDNISRDDGFFIYAALQSGLGAHIVSNDLLRDHKYRLGDFKLKETFLNWQRMHQVFSTSFRKKLKLVPPPVFKTQAQTKDGQSWHIPYDDGGFREDYELPHTWICLHSNSQNHENSTVGNNVSDTIFKSLETFPDHKSVYRYDNFGINEDSRRNKNSENYLDRKDYGGFSKPSSYSKNHGDSRKHYRDYSAPRNPSSDHYRESRAQYSKQKKSSAKNKMRDDIKSTVNRKKTVSVFDK